MAPKIYHLHPLVAGDLSDWPVHFARCRAMGFDTVCVAPPFVPGASGDIFVTADHEALHPALGWPGSRRCRHRAHHAQAARAWVARLAGPRDRPGRDRCRRSAGARSEWFAPGGCGALPSPRRAPHRLDVAYARLQQTEIAEAMAGLVAGPARTAGAGGRRRVPLPRSRSRAAIAAGDGSSRLSAQQCRFLAWTPGRRTCGAAATGRRRLRPRVFLARLVGRARGLAGRGDRAAAAHRAGDRLARAVVLRPARGAAGAGQRCRRRPIASRCGWPRPPASGMFVPMGFEYATRRPFRRRTGRPGRICSARATRRRAI